MFLVIALRQAAQDYLYAIKPRDVAIIQFAKSWSDSKQHLQGWIEKSEIIRLLLTEMVTFRRRAVVHQALVPNRGASCPEVRTTIHPLGMADHVNALLAIANRKLSSNRVAHLLAPVSSFDRH
jgi:hypothetical protein